MSKRNPEINTCLHHAVVSHEVLITGDYRHSYNDVKTCDVGLPTTREVC